MQEELEEVTPWLLVLRFGMAVPPQEPPIAITVKRKPVAMFFQTMYRTNIS